MRKTTRKKPKIDMVDGLHAIRRRFADASQDKILEEAGKVRKKIAKKRSLECISWF